MIELFFLVASIHFLAVASPGPDFVMVVKNSVQGGRTAGIFTAFGISLALLVHIFYCAVGLGILISKSIILFSIIKILGACYLLYLGWKLISAPKNPVEIEETQKQKISIQTAFLQGFWCNILNPKAALYFVSLFALVLPPDVPVWFLASISAEMVFLTAFWFTLVALFFSLPKVQKSFNKIEFWLNKTLGSILIFFGIKVLLSSAK